MVLEELEERVFCASTYYSVLSKFPVVISGNRNVQSYSVVFSL